MFNTKFLVRSRKNSKPSSGEKIIIQFLKTNNINYIREWHHPELINSKSGCKMFFDFYLTALNTIIEVDGAQHHQIINGKVKEFEYQQMRDEIKNMFCLDRGIKLIRIPYKDLKAPFSVFTKHFAGCTIPTIEKTKEVKRKKAYRKHQKNIKNKDEPKNEKFKKKSNQRLIDKNLSMQKETEKRRNEARLKYPTEFKLYISEKNDLQIQNTITN